MRTTLNLFQIQLKPSNGWRSKDLEGPVVGVIVGGWAVGPAYDNSQRCWRSKQCCHRHYQVADTLRKFRPPMSPKITRKALKKDRMTASGRLTTCIALSLSVILYILPGSAAGVSAYHNRWLMLELLLRQVSPGICTLRTKKWRRIDCCPSESYDVDVLFSFLFPVYFWLSLKLTKTAIFTSI